MRGAVAGLIFVVMTATALAQDAALAVAVGGGTGNACPQQGKATGDIEVRVGPGEKYEVYDRLENGETVFLCETAKGWIGIVYGKADCGVSKPITPRQGYIGACNTGWVSSRSLTATAG